MKRICKLTLATVVFTLIFTTVGLKAQETDDSDIGLTVGLDYSSNYIYRGEYYIMGNRYNGSMISPYFFYDVFNTGLSLGMKAEVSEMWFFGNKDEMRGNLTANIFNSIDFNINYIYSFKKIIKFNIGSWYYRHEKLQDGSNSLDTSYIDFYFSTTIEALPLEPTFAITYSYYMDENYYKGYDNSGVWGKGSGKNGDLYVQLGIGNSYQLVGETYMDLDVMVGFYNKNVYDIRVMDDSNEDTKSTDISDIDLSAGLTTKEGILTLSTSFHYVIVPGTQYKYALLDSGMTKDIHRFYAKFGVACSI